jgi:hypothetical protein
LIVKSEYFGAVDLVPTMREMQFKLQGAQDRNSMGAAAGGYEITAAKADKLVNELRQRVSSYPDEGLKRILTHELDKLETAFDVLTSGSYDPYSDLTKLVLEHEPSQLIFTHE